MTLLSRLLDRGDPVETRTIRDNAFWQRWAAGDDIGLANMSYAGVPVTRDTALGVSTVWACVSLYGDTIATLPVDVAKTDDQGVVTRQKRPGWLDAPNSEQTRVEWIFSQIASLLLDGNIFMYTVRDGRGEVIEAWPIDPKYVQVRREYNGKGKLVIAYYLTVAAGAQSPVQAMRVEQGPDMFHIPYFQVGSNWPRGLAPLEIARQMFGGGIAGQEMSARFFGQGMNASGVIEVPDGLQPDQARILKRDFAEANAGLKNMHLPPVLTGGATYKQVSINPEQAQFLQSREFTVAEVARWFRVPPFMVGELTKSTSWGTGIEQQAMGFVGYSLRPLLERIEEAWSKWLLFPGRPNQRVRFNVEGLLRGDRATRTAWYTAGRNGGWLSANDVRIEEGYAPLEEGGDEYLTPMNMMPPAGVPAAEPLPTVDNPDTPTPDPTVTP